MDESKFKQELDLIDQYVDIKDKGDGEPIIVNLIENHFLPQGRIEEARTWRNAINDKALKESIGEAIKSAIKSHPVSTISRMPQNIDWPSTSPVGKAHKTEDQQYHYNRTISYSNATKQMLDQIDDVRICRNEWITFVARNAYIGGLGDLGAELDVLAMAISDYIELILLPNNFVKSEGAQETSNSLQASASSGLTVKSAYTNRPELPQYLGQSWPQLVDDIFLCNFFVKDGAEGKEEEVVVTRSYIAFVPKKHGGWGGAEAQVIPRDTVTQISVGTDFHTQYQGLFSTSTTYWTLTFETSNYTQFTRWMYLGRDEREMNQNRPDLGVTLEQLGKHFQLVQGSSFQTSDGYTTSFGYGYWWH